MKGFSRESAWWAFNRLGTLSAQRWGDMRKDVTTVWKPMQNQLLADQPKIEQEAVSLLKKNPSEARKYLTNYTVQWGEKVIERAWRLGDEIWTKYDENW